jgi:cation transport ATPase
LQCHSFPAFFAVVEGVAFARISRLEAFDFVILCYLWEFGGSIREDLQEGIYMRQDDWMREHRWLLKSTVCQTTIGHGQGAGCENTRGCCDSKVKETTCHSTRGTGAHQGQPSWAVAPNPTSHIKRHSTDGLGAEAADIEKASPGIEHVVLSVEGLTCVGCENKLFKSVDVLPQVHNLQTSLVMSQAEFDLDLMNTSVEDVIHSVERATGFKCQRLSRNGQCLHVNASSNTEQVIERILSKGVLSATLLDRQTIRIEYDPSVVGARDLLATIDDSTVHLAPPQSSPALAVGNRHVRHTGLLTLFSAVMTIPVLILAWAPLPQHDIAYGSVSLALATVVQIIVAGPFYPSAIKALVFTHVIEMDLLIVLSTTTAYIFSVVPFAFQVKGAPLSTGEFFETSALLVTLIMLGQFISALARQKAVESISIKSLQVNTTLLVQPDGTPATKIDSRLLQYGDCFKVMAESRIATDGTVVLGHSDVDESMVTGEAQRLEKVPGSAVIAGSINGSGILTVLVRRLPDDNTISEIARMVDEAKFSKPKVQDMADRVASYFVPVIVVLALITFCIWVAVRKAVRNEASSTAIVNAITYAIAALIVSCPCDRTCCTDGHCYFRWPCS